MSIELSQDWVIIKNILTNRRLANAYMYDDELELLKKNNWKLDKSREYLLWKDNGTYKGLVQLHTLTDTTLVAHIALLPDYRGTKDSYKLGMEVNDWLAKNTNFLKVVTYVPSPCKHVVRFLGNSGFEIEGVLTSALIWRESLENLIIMSTFINRQGAL